jgi:hypothetical protein
MLTHQQVEFFHENGFLHFPGVIGDLELERLRSRVSEIVADPEQLPAASHEDFKYGALVGDDDIGEGDQLCRIEYTFDKGLCFLLLLANPRVLEIACSLQSVPIVATWEDLIYKTPKAGFGVKPHQDALFQSVDGIVLSIGLYLDDSDHDPLFVLPGTHRLGQLHPDQIARIASLERERLIDVPVRRGDALVHNVRVIHGSRPNESDAPRRVIYLEFRTPDQILDDSPWDADWLERRLALIPSAIALRAESDLYERDDPELWAELLTTRDRWLPPAPALPYHELDLRVHHHDVAQR